MPARKNPSQYGPKIVDPLAALDALETAAPDRAVAAADAAPALDTAPVADPPVVEQAVNSRPKPERELTPEQRRIRELEDLLARERGRKEPDEELERPGDGETIVIHFLEDGATAAGRVWVRGQELEFDPNGQAYADTVDRTGRSWLDLRFDEGAQMERWGKVMFRNGPWPGKPWTAVTGEKWEPLANGTGGRVSSPSAEELERAAREEARRARAVPRLPVR